MMLTELDREIMDFADVLHEIATNITGKALYERLPPAQLWKKAEVPVTRLLKLTESLRDKMLTLKPEKKHSIEQRCNAITNPLESFKEIILRNAEPQESTKLALEQLRSVVLSGSDLLSLAKEIRNAISPAINEILKLREIYVAKDYISSVQVPDALKVRLTNLIEQVNALETAVMGLENALKRVKGRVVKLQKEAMRLRFSEDKSKEKI